MPDRQLQIREVSRQRIDQVGEVLLDAHPAASHLISLYFDSAFSELANDVFIPADFEAWLDTVEQFSEENTTVLYELIKLCGEIPWRDLSSLRLEFPETSLQLTQYYPALLTKFGPEVASGVPVLLSSLARADQPAAEVLDYLSAMDNPGHDTMCGLLRLGEQLPQAELYLTLLKNREKLPLQDEGILATWLQAGLDIQRGNPLAAHAFFAVESARSVDLLSALRGEVRFDTAHRVLQIYSEAMSERKIRIASHDCDNNELTLPDTDGLTIRVPRTASLFDSPEKNFKLYKIALLHQLGYFECGTFSSLTRIETVLRSQDCQPLARRVFQLIEDVRVDSQLSARYRGAAHQIRLLQSEALAQRVQTKYTDSRAELLEMLVRLSLGDDDCKPGYVSLDDVEALRQILAPAMCHGAGIEASLAATVACLSLLPASDAAEVEMPAPVVFRGTLDTDKVIKNLALWNLLPNDSDMISISAMLDPSQLNLDDISRGEVDAGIAKLSAELAIEAEDSGSKRENRPDSGDLPDLTPPGLPAPVDGARQFQYDEWDYLIGDYRTRWCTLYERRNIEQLGGYADQVTSEYPALRKRIRRQLNRLRPELLKKVRGTPDGEELDLERVLEAVVDRRVGMTPSENVYVQRLRKGRDVSALFLIDMSASTDALVAVTDNTPPEAGAEDEKVDQYPYLHTYSAGAVDLPTADTGKKIIDLERESVVLMAEALEELGDNYAISGFSGNGKDQVDYYLCKDFSEPWNYVSQGRVGGMKPCRSTRMGPAIRHATKSLAATESRLKTLIIISDGYPQDHDYGFDRSSREYGLKDTMKSISEATRQGVQTFCLTVDPSGHDYLREMCPDNQYMVIQDIQQLPDELSKIYRRLTG